MKKILKIAKIVFLVLISLAAVGAGVLYLMFPPSKIKTMAQDFVRKNYSREIDYDGFSFNLIGVNLHNFKISEVGTFENGTFAQADNLVVKADLMSLLKKEVKVNKLLLQGIKINVIKNQDGTFNFDNFIKPSAEEAPKQEAKTGEAQQKETQENIKVDIDNIKLEDSSFYYTDKQSGMDFKVEHVNLAISNFSLRELFPFALDLQTSLDMGAAKIAPLDLNYLK